MARKKTGKKRKGTKKSRPQSLADLEKIHWRSILIGFEGDAFLPPADREGQVISSRKAIEENFKEGALRRWVNGKKKVVDISAEAGDFLDALAAVTTKELNAARKAGCRWRFSVRKEDSLVRFALASNTPVSPGPDIKPDGVVCLYHHGKWYDEVEFPIWVEDKEEAESDTLPAARRMRRGGAPHRGHQWKPDARHALVVRLVFQCPFEILSRQEQ